MNEPIQSNLAAAVRALREGTLDLAALGRIIDGLLTGGATVESLREAVTAAQAANRISPDETATLLSVISDSMTVYTGTAEIDDRTALYVQHPGDPAAAPADPLIGTRLRDRFIVDEVMGVGGMGTVYKGRDALKVEAHDRNPFIAIKVLNESFARRPDAFIALQREASRQQSLAHPNIATVFDFDRSGQTVFITMELLKGDTMDKFIRAEVRPRGGLPLKEALPLIEAMCAALKHAHDRGIVHADFKPGNCFVSEQRGLKVLDFGIARAMKDPNAPPRDQTLFDPRLIGALTPAYASPEMLDNSADPDPRDDIYALACVAYELLSGAHPFMRVPANAAKDQDLKPARIKSISRRQNETLQRGLAFEREQRIGSASELLRGLAAAEQRPLAKIAVAVLSIALLSAGTVFLIGYLDRRSTQQHLAQLASDDPAVVGAAIAAMKQEAPEVQQRMLVDGRERLLEHFSKRFDALTAQPPDSIPFADVEALLVTGEELYPDSAALRDLRSRFTQQRAAYLSDLAERFEDYLQPQHLVPSNDRDDLHDVLQRIGEVDPGNALLGDMRVASAYARAAQGALARGELTAAHQLVASGLGLRASDPALLDLRDRVAETEAAEKARERLEQLRARLAEIVSGIRSASDLVALEAPLEELEQLAPGGGDAAKTGQAVKEHLKGETEPLRQATQLPGLEAFLQAHASQLELLRLQPLLTELQARRDFLVAERDARLGSARTQLGAASPVASRQAAIAGALAGVAEIDPGYLQNSGFPNEIVEAQLARVAAASIDNDWAPALAELDLAIALGLSADAQAVLSAKRAEIERRQQEYLAQVESERVAASERRRREEIERLESGLREQRERLSFDRAGLGALRGAGSRLLALDPANALVPATYTSATDALLERARAETQRGDTEAASALLGLAAEIAPDPARVQGARTELTAARERIEAQQHGQRIAQRVSETDALLEDAAALDSEAHQRRLRDALGALEQIAPGSAELDEAKARVTAAYVARSNALIEQQRFSSAASLLDAAEAQAGVTDAVAAARRTLEQKGAEYAKERTRLELQARVQGGRERFQHEVESVQLARAQKTLREMAALAPQDAYFSNEAPKVLAAAYVSLAQRNVAAGKFDDATEAIRQGRILLPGDPGLDTVEAALHLRRIRQRVLDWISGRVQNTAAEVRSWAAEFERAATPEQAKEAGDAWSAAARARLQALRADPEAHNRALRGFQAVWDRDPILAAIQPLKPPAVATSSARPAPGPEQQAAAPANAPLSAPEPSRTAQRDDAPAPQATPTPPAAVVARAPEPPAQVRVLGADNLLGKWCGKDVNLEFQPTSLRFLIGRGQAVEYPIKGYASETPSSLTVSWLDQRQGLMLFEFGGFSDDGEQMTQLRGRAQNGDWQRYDRAFRRCP